MSELDDVFGEESAELLRKAIASILAQYMAMADSEELPKAIAKMCRNSYKAFQEAGFSDDQAFQLTMAVMKNNAKS